MSDKPSLSDLIGPDHKLRASMEHIARNIELFCKAAEASAEIRRASYNAALKQGFTKDEALELCKRPIM